MLLKIMICLTICQAYGSLHTFQSLQNAHQMKMRSIFRISNGLDKRIDQSDVEFFMQPKTAIRKILPHSILGNFEDFIPFVGNNPDTMQPDSRIRYDRGILQDGKHILSGIVDQIPFEAHIPSYRYCGPGTKLEEKLALNIPGINPLDEACKQHDIAYLNNPSVEDRDKADRILENAAWSRVIAPDAKFGEKAAAWVITNSMKLLRKRR